MTNLNSEDEATSRQIVKNKSSSYCGVSYAAPVTVLILGAVEGRSVLAVLVLLVFDLAFTAAVPASVVA